jgi:hypothetical protein
MILPALPASFQPPFQPRPRLNAAPSSPSSLLAKLPRNGSGLYIIYIKKDRRIEGDRLKAHYYPFQPPSSLLPALTLPASTDHIKKQIK